MPIKVSTFAILGFVYSKSGRYDAEYRTDDCRIGQHIPATGYNGSRTRGNGTKVRKVYSVPFPTIHEMIPIFI